MELQFNKTVIPCLRMLSREMQTQEQTQEVRITDGMPDIGRVLGCWGQILIRGKEWRTGGAGVSGGVMVWILYAPEDGTEPQSVETWLPFQLKWDFPETQRDGTIRVMPMLRSVDARTLSARKLMVRTGVGMLGEAMIPAEVEVCSPGDLPEDVHVLKSSYPMQVPREAGEKAFVLDEILSLPVSVPQIERIIRYHLRPEVVDQKILADKLVIRGVGNLELLYCGADGQLHSWDFELPFSQYAELDKEYDTGAMAQINLAVTSLELEQGEEENLSLKVGLTGQYVIYDRPVIELVEDVYSPYRSVKTQISELQIPAVLDNYAETVHAEHNVDIDGARVADVAFFPDHPQLHREGDKISTELSGMFQLLYYNADGQLQSTTSRWNGDWSLDVSRAAQMHVSAQVSARPQALLSGGNANLRVDMTVEAQTTADQGIPMVTGVDLGEMSEPDPGRPSLILRRAGTDRLWDIAKRAGSSVEAICEANGLQQEPDSEQILLIPVS